MIDIHFDPIDSKDGHHILGTDKSYLGEESKHNRNLLFQARMEYLEELDKLQQKIQKKFGGMLDNNIPDETVDVDYQNDSWQDMMKYGRLYYT